MIAIQRLTLIITVVLIVAVNAWYATGFRFLSNSVQHPVEPKYASAYLADKNEQFSVPLLRSASFSDVEAYVTFYIRNDYCGTAEYTSSRLTLIFVGLGGIIWRISGKRLSSSKTS